MNKIKWLNPSWIDSEVRNQFPHGAYGAQHNPDDVDKLVEAATKVAENNHCFSCAKILEKVLKPFKPEVGDE